MFVTLKVTKRAPAVAFGFRNQTLRIRSTVAVAMMLIPFGSPS